MTRSTFPQKHHRAYKLLQVLAAGPGTFYQICERANLDLNGKYGETELREIFEQLVRAGRASKTGIIYSISDAARAALKGKPAPYAGQVAGPAPRGVPYCAPVRHVVAPKAVRP